MGEEIMAGNNPGIRALFCNDDEGQNVFERSVDVQEQEPEEALDEEVEIEQVQEETKPQKVGQKVQKSVSAKIIDPEEVKKFEEIKRALWTEYDSDVIKWCLDKAYRANKKKIKMIIAERERLEEEKRRIGTL